MIRRLAGRAYSSSVGHGSKAPTAGDILYRNPEAMCNRLKLFHLYRLQTQSELDFPHLQGMAKDFPLDESKHYVRISTRYLDNAPGIEGQFEPGGGCVAFSFSPAALGLEQEQQNLLLKLVGEKYDVDTGYVRFDVKHFPFKEMNERLGREVVRDLVAYVRDESTDRFSDVPLEPARSRRKPHLQFPESWLPKRTESSQSTRLSLDTRSEMEQNVVA